MTQTIGQRLKAEREAQKLTLEKVFEVTRIRVPYLQALETDDLSSVPSPVQARGYLRNYAEYLGLDFQQLLDEMRVNMQGTSGEVIGPADDMILSLPSSGAQDNGAFSTQAEPQTSETGLVDLAPETSIVEEETPIASPPPKRGRRKKADPPTESASAESTTRRRGRKKVQPEPVPTPEPEILEPPQQEPVIVEAPAAQTHPEPVLDPAVEISVEDATQADVGDTLWQKWLNRIGSVVSARMRRRTFVPKESRSSEDDPTLSLGEPDARSAGDAHRAVVEAQDPSSEHSSEIFREIGARLRERRELLSLHLDEVERNTHVKAHYLMALEKGAMDELPSTVQTRGMLSNYATFLDMDVDALLLRFADALQARHRERNPQKPARKPGQPIVANVPPIRTFIAGDIIFGVGAAVLLVGFAIWGVSRVVELQSQQEIQLTAPSISDVLLASPDPSQLTATPTLQPVEAFPGPATMTLVIPTQDVNVGVQVNLVATERTYMRVVVDGEVAFEGRVVPGNAYPFQAESQIEVMVGSGAGIRTVYNGRDLGLMGTFGQVVTNIYTADEIITPTALPSPSPTITVSPTATVPGTATISATDSPVPSGTPTP
ncbi:MAG TPA: RodZ domain-containing protein [Anaerolineales bacterium]|nr:RodZ domain-containing protein [Anaerolineales bacterium]